MLANTPSLADRAANRFAVNARRKSAGANYSSTFFFRRSTISPSNTTAIAAQTMRTIAVSMLVSFGLLSCFLAAA
jgi:hypothetical protein